MKLFKLLTFILINKLILSQIITVETPIFLKKGIEVPSASLYGALSNSVDFGVVDLIKSTPSQLNEKMEEAYLYLGLDFGENFVFEAPNLVFEVKLKVEYKIDEAGSTWKEQEIIISQTTPEFKIKLDIKDDLMSITDDLNKKLRLKVSYSDVDIVDGINDNFFIGATSSLMNNYIQNKLRLRAVVEQKFGVDVRIGPLMVVAPVINQVGNINKRFTFKWTSAYEFPNYEIQILRLHNTDETKITDPKKIKYELNWDNALKIETQSFQKEIDLTLMEGTGYYVWRVRPIGNFYEGGIANQENYGLWSQEIAQTADLIDYPDINNTTSNLPVFYYNDQEENLNWIYTRVFSEGDLDHVNGTKTKEGISYADPLLRARQTQVYNSEENTNLVGQSLIDYSGRPSLSTLPVPISSSVIGLEGYVSNFVKNSSGQLYTALDFDAQSTHQSPSKIYDIPGSKFDYYNGQNQDGVSGTDGYSYTRTIFKTDGTNRVSESSGIGETFAIGTTHTTRIFYGSAADEELIRVFGDEAPLAESVIKTITIDPNGTQSVTYTSKEGKTIASALISNSTPNLLALNANDNGFTITHSTTQNIIDEKVFQSTKRFVLPGLKDVTLEYKILNGGPPCTDCNYKVQFYLIDLENNITYVSDADGYLLGQTQIKPFDAPNSGLLDFSLTPNWKWVLSSAADQSLISQPNGGVFQLPEGEYLLVKRVFSSQSDISTDELNDVETIMSIIASQLSNVQNEADIINFNTFMSGISGSNPSITGINNLLPFDAPIAVFPSILTITYTGTGSVLGELSFNIQGTENNPNNPGQACADCPNQTISLGAGESCKVCDEIQEVIDNSTDLTIESEDWKKIRNLVRNGSEVENIDFDGFIEYLRENEVYKLAAADSGELMQQIAPGFNEEKLAFMFTNMLVSRYYTGNITDLGKVGKENPATGLIEVSDLGTGLPTPIDPADPLFINTLDFNYTCKDLYVCWISAVDLIKLNEFEDEEVNVMDQYNDQADDSSEDEFDNEENQEDAEDKSGFDKLLDVIISRKMRKFNDSDEGKLSKEGLLSLVNLVNTFYACAGYQFAGIIDESSVNLYTDYNYTYNFVNAVAHAKIGDPLPHPFTFEGDARYSDAYQLMKEPVAGQLAARSFGSSACTTPVLYPRMAYPYILKPEWMFKYFEYNAKNELLPIDGMPRFSDVQLVFTNQLDIELASCYNDISSFITGTTCQGQQSCKKCNYYHQQWNSGQRLNFYKQIKGSYKVPPFLCNDIEVPLNLTAPVVDPYEEAKKDLDEAIGMCDYRKGEFMQTILSKLDAACYDLVECVTTGGTGTFTMDDVDYMAQQVVESCIQQIKLIGPKIGYTYVDAGGTSTSYTDTNPVSDYSKNADINQIPELGEYPFYNSYNCKYPVVINISGDLGCVGDEFTIIKLFTDCDQAILDLANSWNLTLDIQPIDPNNCSTYSANGYQYSPPSPDCGVSPGGPSATTSSEVVVPAYPGGN